MSERENRLRHMLPAGDYADVALVSDPVGMMAEGYEAILATARWLRGGGVQAFIKCFIPASASAGPQTNMVTGAERLERLGARLEALRDSAGSLPIVEVLDVLAGDGGELLVAMTRVETIHDRIRSNSGGDICLAIKILERLYPEKNGTWHHFDVDPKNIGVTALGQVVLIDLESIYELEAECYRVTVPAWKGWRSPRALVAQVNIGQANGLGRATARRKQAYEVLLAAAECSLGALASFQEADNEQDGLRQWLDTFASKRPALADLWKRILLAFPTSADAPVIDALLRELEELRDADGSASGEPLVPREAPRADQPSPSAELAPSAEPRPVAEVTPATTTAGTTTRSPDMPVAGRGHDRDGEWVRLAPLRRAMRTRELSAGSLLGYEADLVALCASNTESRQGWKELLLLRIVYKRDPAGALVAVNDAIEALPGDEYLATQLQLIEMWIGRIGGSRVHV